MHNYPKPSISLTGGRSTEAWRGLTLLRGYCGEGGHQLVHALAAAMWTLDFSFFDVGDVEALGEFPVAVLAMIEVLRHNPTPAIMIPPVAVEGLLKIGQIAGVVEGQKRPDRRLKRNEFCIERLVRIILRTGAA